MPDSASRRSATVALVVDLEAAPRWLGRPSPCIALCALATLAPTVYLLLPQESTAPNTASDYALGSAYLIPQLVALALSALRTRPGRTMTTAAAALGLGLALVTIPLYGLGLLFVGQAAVATGVAVRRGSRR